MDQDPRLNSAICAAYAVAAVALTHPSRVTSVARQPFAVRTKTTGFQRRIRFSMLLLRRLRVRTLDGGAKLVPRRRSPCRTDGASRTRRRPAFYNAAPAQARPMQCRSAEDLTMARKYGKKASEKVEKAMHERKRGTLRSGSGKKVKSRKQAIAIGLSQARRAGGKVPKQRSSRRRSSARRRRAS